MLQDTRLQRIPYYAGIGAAWNLGNVSFKKIQWGEPMVWRKLARAIALGAVAGAIVGMQGGDPTPGNFEIAMGAAVPLTDKLVNTYESGAHSGSGDSSADGD